MTGIGYLLPRIAGLFLEHQMASFRILNQFPVYFDLAGRPASGGRLDFFESNTTTPKSVYGGPDLTPDNGSTVAIEADGRTAVDIWGDGAYRVRLYDADNTLIAEADDVEIAGGDATTIPALVDGYFLSNNGSLLLWASILQLPDPTGQDGKMVVADGAGYILQSIPEPPTPVDPEIVVDGTAKSFQAGVSDSTTKYFVQAGTGSAPASGSRNTTGSVVFDTPFVTLWSVSVTQNHNGVTADGHVPSQTVTTKSATGFTARFSTDENSTSSAWNIINEVPFMWVAVGTIEVAPVPVP